MYKPAKIGLLLLTLQCVVAAVFADDDDNVAPATAQSNTGVISLDEKTQVASGLQTTTLDIRQWDTEFTITGKALSIQPLITLRHRYLALLAENQQAVATFKQVQQNTQRQQALYQHGIIAKRTLQEQQLQLSAEQSLVTTNTLQTKAIVDEARLAWGDQLAGLALNTDATKMAPFLSGNAVLLQVSLPPDTAVLANKVIFVEASGRRDKATKACLMSDAPQADSPVPGQSYFFKGQGKAIKPGMRVVGWVSDHKHATAGIMLPKSAGVWLLDQLVVYVKTGKNTFVRRLVDDYTITPEGYFTATGFTPGDEVVTTGAQMLLSEEQRRQIPDEDD